MAAKKTSKKTAPKATKGAVGSQKAYDEFLPEAEKVEDVRPYRNDAQLAYVNIETGLQAIAPHADRIKAELPKISLTKLHKLGDLALALIYAAAQVDRSGDGAILALLTRARELRETMLATVAALVTAGLVPAKEYARIKAGSGQLDTAQDCVDLAALFHKHHAKLKGKTPITAAQIKEAAQVGTELQKRLKPKGAKAKDPAAEAVAIRDRLWTLLVTRHKDLRRVGMWLWVDDADEHVPPLQSRNLGPRKHKNKDKDKGADAPAPLPPAKKTAQPAAPDPASP